MCIRDRYIGGFPAAFALYSAIVDFTVIKAAVFVSLLVFTIYSALTWRPRKPKTPKEVIQPKPNNQYIGVYGRMSNPCRLIVSLRGDFDVFNSYPNQMCIRDRPHAMRTFYAIVAWTQATQNMQYTINQNKSQDKKHNTSYEVIQQKSH